MARYIDVDKLIVHLKDELNECDIVGCEGDVGKSVAYGTALGLKMAISFAETLSPIDVVPKSEWISVEDRLPEQHTSVIVCDKDGFVGEAEWDGTSWGWVSYEHVVEITHWMPFPEPPKEGQS